MAGLQEEAARNLVESAPDAIVVVDRDGCILLVNAQAEHLFGYRREDLLGETVEILVPERFREAHVGQRQRYVADPYRRAMGARGLELFGRRKDGSEFPAEISLGPLEDQTGTMTIAIIRDATEQRTADVVRRRAEATLGEMARLLRSTWTRDEG